MNVKKLFLFVIFFIVGCIVGAVFYPSKTIIKKVEVTSDVDKQTIANLKIQINSLENSNKKLSEKTHTIIVQNKDGSKRTEIHTESDLYETKKKEIQSKYEKKLAEYKKEISKLKEYNKIEINKKSFAIEIGINTNKSYYGHVSYDVLGSLFIGGHVSVGNTNNLGVGIGLRL